MRRKGITPVIAIVLLLMMTVAAAGGAYVWASGLLDDLMGTAEDEADRGIAIQSLVCYNQAQTVGDGAYVEVFFQNTGTKQLDLDPVDMNVRDRSTGDINFTLTRTGMSLARETLGPRAAFKFGDGFAEPGSSSAYIIGLPDRFERGRNYEVEFVFTDEDNTVHTAYCQAQTGGEDTFDVQQVDDGSDDGSDDGGDGTDDGTDNTTDDGSDGGTDNTTDDGSDGGDAVGRSIGIEPGSLSGPGRVEEDETVVVSAGLMNNGSERGEETLLFAVSNETGMVREDGVDVTLDPGERRDVSTAFSPPPVGNYTVSVSCDGCTFNTREETDLAVVERSGEPVAGPYLVLRSLDAPGTVGTGEVFDVAAAVDNTGNATGDVSVSFLLEDDGGTVMRSSVSSSIAAGAGSTLNLSLQSPDRGMEGLVRAVCDVCNETVELTRRITVEPPARPDIGIEAVRAPSEAEKNMSVEFYVTLRNRGDAAGDRGLRYELVGDGTVVMTGSRTVSVDADREETVAFEVILPDRPGNMTLQVRCDTCERSRSRSSLIRVTAPAPEEDGGLPVVVLVVVLVVLLAAMAGAGYYVFQKGEEVEEERQQRRQGRDLDRQPPRREDRDRRDGEYRS